MPQDQNQHNSNQPITPHKIFMIDDSVMNCLCIQELVERVNRVEFQYCVKGQEALSVISQFHPSVILLDLIMPDADGFELLRQYRKDPVAKNIPVIIFSGENDPKIKVKAFSLGASDYIQKGDDPEELVARLLYHSRRYLDLAPADSCQLDLKLPTKHTVKVFMVDESQFACKIVGQMFANEENVSFSSCTDPAKAILRAEEFMPTVIIQSLSLDDFAGMGLLKTFRAAPGTRDVPIIILSGTQDTKIKIQALECGANDYILKSAEKSELISRVKIHSSEYYNLLRSRFSQTQTEVDTANIPVKVLMIDDSKFFCTTVGHMLSNERNIVFHFCTEPKLAFDITRELAPTVILLDLEMPELTGFDLLSIFRDNPYTFDIPVIVLSGTTTSAIKAKAFTSGANDYMEKKMDKIELISRIQYHSRAYLNSVRLKDSIQELLEAHKRLELQGNFIRKTFGRYLSDEIVSSILESPDGLELGGEQREITIMMTDLRGFTSLSESLPPEDVLAILNNYLLTMTDILQNGGGTIDEFIGDAILAMFGAPHIRDDDAERAVSCAVAMQLAMATVNKWNREHGYPDVAMGIGVHTGTVVVGNIGSVKRSKYGIVGKNVNLTSRIESYTVGGQILVSAQTLDACGPILRVDSTLEVMPKGVSEPITLYEIGGIGGGHNLYLPEKKEGNIRRLAAPLPMKITVLEGKHGGALCHEALLVAVDGRDGEMECALPLERMVNIKGTLFDESGGFMNDGLYAKVLELPPDGSGSFRINFTFLPVEAARFLDEQERQPE